jgi:hypothetical protein
MPKRLAKIENGVHATDIQDAAIRHITVFFQDKAWYCGGKIPRHDLFSDSSIRTVLRTQFDSNWEACVHHKCLSTVPVDHTYRLEAHLPWTVRYLIDLIYSMGLLSIPKEFRPGMVLLYFKFCKGVKIIPPVL